MKSPPNGRKTSINYNDILNNFAAGCESVAT